MSGPPIDEGFELLPPDPALLSPDLALDAALAPVVTLQPDAPQPLGRGWAFDFLTGRFVRHGASPAEVYDIDHLRVWIEKTLRTARYAHPIYTDNYGIEEPFRLIGQPYDADLIATHQEAIVEALTAHDRIAAVEDFYFQHDPMDDALYVTFTAVLDSPPDVTVQVSSFPITAAAQGAG